MLKLKKSLQYIFNSKNYKFLIYLLIGLILVFLICGNYNLLEGITSRKLEESLNDTHDEVSRGENVINKKEIDSRNEESKYRNLIEKKHTDTGIIRNRIVQKTPSPDRVIESFLEGMNCNNTQYSEQGAGKKSNSAVYNMCRGNKALTEKNNGLMKDGYIEKKDNI